MERSGVRSGYSKVFRVGVALHTSRLKPAVRAAGIRGHRLQAKAKQWRLRSLNYRMRSAGSGIYAVVERGTEPQPVPQVLTCSKAHRRCAKRDPHDERTGISYSAVCPACGLGTRRKHPPAAAGPGTKRNREIVHSPRFRFLCFRWFRFSVFCRT
jgi:hypothetical protein